MKKISIKYLLAVQLALAFSQNANTQNAIALQANEPVMRLIAENRSQSNLAGQVLPLPVPVSAETAGTWSPDREDYEVWRLPVHVDGQYGTVVFFEKLALPPGSELKASTADFVLETRTFTENPNTGTQAFALPLLPANDIVVEARVPAGRRRDFVAVIEKLGTVVVDELYEAVGERGFGDAPDCYANVNCPEGQPWQGQKRSVVKYMTVNGTDIGFCTGVLVNNTAGDCKNYLLSAQHCGIGATIAELGQFVFYFNYEAPTCDNPPNETGLNTQTVVGCVLLASSGSSVTLPPNGSDFQLLELNPVPAAYNVYFSGWNRLPLAQLPGNGAIIQHPQSDIKKISFWDIAEPGGTSIDHLSFNMVASASGEGTVEGNSSGAPVFDGEKRVVANVTHGNSGCISDLPSGIAKVGAGSFEWHWDQNGTQPKFQLKPWLDPTNSGATTLDGKNQCGSTPALEIAPATLVFSLVPNPTSRTFNVRSEAEVEAVELFDIAGRRLLSIQNDVEIDVSALPPGVYLVKIQTRSGNVSGRLVKQ